MSRQEKAKSVGLVSIPNAAIQFFFLIIIIRRLVIIILNNYSDLKQNYI